MKIRKAEVRDLKQIHNLINSFAKKDLMLPKSLNQLYENIRDFWVLEEAKKIWGCCALHICWDELAEIKSFAVNRVKQGKGFGSEMVKNCLKEAKSLGAKKVFVLTFKPEYFKKLGFKKISHSDLPHKIWAECINCPKFPDCNESALLKTL